VLPVAARHQPDLSLVCGLQETVYRILEGKSLGRPKGGRCEDIKHDSQNMDLCNSTQLLNQKFLKHFKSYAGTDILYSDPSYNYMGTLA
jgi:hypothetical protein